jgi:hypothetical protein
MRSWWEAASNYSPLITFSLPTMVVSINTEQDRGAGREGCGVSWQWSQQSDMWINLVHCVAVNIHRPGLSRAKGDVDNFSALC